jgi:hypothetical protein
MTLDASHEWVLESLTSLQLQEPNARFSLRKYLNVFLSSQNGFHDLKRLTLNGYMSPEIFKGRIKILNHLKDSLEEVKFSGKWVPNAPTYLYKYPKVLLESFEFKKLKKFSLSLTAYFPETNLSFQENCKWLELFIPGLKTVEKIVLSGNFIVSLKYLEILENHVKSFVNLKGIDISQSENGKNDKIEGNLLHFLINNNARMPLNSLKVRCFDPQHIPSFEKMLQQHAKTLKVLHLDVSDDENKVTQIMSIQFPILPSLKELKVIGGEKGYSLKIVFPSKNGKLCYSQHFPCLQILSLNRKLYPCSIDKYVWDGDGDDFFDMFLPNLESKNDSVESNICKSLRVLDIQYQSRDDDRVCPRLGEISVVFPNVHNKWINQVRKK